MSFHSIAYVCSFSPQLILGLIDLKKENVFAYCVILHGLHINLCYIRLLAQTSAHGWVLFFLALNHMQYVKQILYSP